MVIDPALMVQEAVERLVCGNRRRCQEQQCQQAGER